MIITDKIKLLPEGPGVYRYLDEDGVVIYVGKAKNLKKRVAQYFQSPEKLTRKTAVMVSKIRDVEHTVVNSEEDALLLENNLIKEYQPKYNILLKDGKTYPWICVKKEPCPRVFLTRRFKKDGSLYFGPYSSVMHAHRLMELINALYPLRNCNLNLSAENIAKGKYKVCLNYHVKKCLAPCIGNISAADYQGQIDSIVEILKGNSSYLIREYDKRMKEAASKLEFELANEYKEKKGLLEKHYSKSAVVHSGIMDMDVFSLIFEGQDAFGNYMKVRNGCIIRSINLQIKMRIEEEQSTVLSSFIAEIYSRNDTEQDNVKEILVPFMPDQEFEGKNVHVPLKGDKLAVLELSRKNAAELRFDRLKQEEFVNPKEHTERILENLKRDLGMDELPRHIECFDNSNIQGTNPVSACVVFKDGTPSKKDYRHFNIKTVVGANDYASMKEVVNRRYTRVLAEGGELPQLIVIDGGRGQVRFAYEALLELGLLDKVKLIGIAERMEELIIPGDPYPMFLDKNSTSLKLIMQLRDEAHRFGITHHRDRRSKGQISSSLDTIPGVGPKSIEKLIAKFKSVARIKMATEADIASVVGPNLARKIKEGLS
ncbi:MAG: excinuclease ABC subunit C [Bacteroidales bacterium]|nr:excinuclease ABC subunit C [Bacteroidales bacterium]